MRRVLVDFGVLTVFINPEKPSPLPWFEYYSDYDGCFHVHLGAVELVFYP